jgi:hypothetical protein
MNEDDRQLAQSGTKAQGSSEYRQHLSRFPVTIAESIEQIKQFALQKFDREIVQKQLYYHTRDHVENVRRRTDEVFRAVFFDETTDSTQPSSPEYRTKLLLDLCAAAHDMVQIFLPQAEVHATRQRQPGVSERATIEHLLAYINDLNHQLRATYDLDDAVQITDDEIQLIRVAIATTVCAYDPIDQAIYQPGLDDASPDLPIVARILALADIGALGMEGIQSYHQEGSLLFLEENLDLIPLLLDRRIDSIALDDPALYENLRQRLLKRCRFQVNFAKSRLKRFKHEIAGFTEPGSFRRIQNVFYFMTPEIIQEVEALTPIDEETSLPDLLDFFQFERYLT